jgi:DNA polymerase I-like protein with 3'-5' exonuclease and polymerase domains
MEDIGQKNSFGWKLKVPLVAEGGIGNNWGETK